MNNNDFIQIPPAPQKRGFAAMPNSEAKQYFDWHMQFLDARIHNMFVALGFHGDYSPESLILLWTKVKQRYALLREQKQHGMISEQIDQDDMLLSGVALYFGEVLRKNHAEASWTYSSTIKKYRNCPVLQGFGQEYYAPSRMILVLSLLLSKNAGDENQLLSLYSAWKKRIKPQEAQGPFPAEDTDSQACITGEPVADPSLKTSIDLVGEESLLAIAIPPKSKPFSEMTNKEARQFFDWYMKYLDARIHNMSVVLGFHADYSPESLATLWKKIMYQYDLVEQYDLRGQGSKQMDLVETLISCAGLYVAETLRHNHPQLSWMCYTTRSKYHAYKNRPVLRGFGHVCFEPENMIQVQAVRLYNRCAKETQLKDLYDKWCLLLKG